MHYRIIFASICVAFFLPSQAFADFKPFKDEAATVTGLIKCPNPKITKDDGLPDLYGCVHPGAEVVKVFINATAGNDAVENVKIMWNDWTRDTGYGEHTDKTLAEAWVSALATRYAPEHGPELLKAFRGVSSAEIVGNEFVVRYTYSRGPAIDERLITVTAK